MTNSEKTPSDIIIANENDIPKTATVHCPLKRMQPRYVVKGCLGCVHYQGLGYLTDSETMPVSDRVTGERLGERPIQWHEKYIIRCAAPMTRRCGNIEIVEE